MTTTARVAPKVTVVGQTVSNEIAAASIMAGQLVNVVNILRQHAKQEGIEQTRKIMARAVANDRATGKAQLNLLNLVVMRLVEKLTDVKFAPITTVDVVEEILHVQRVKAAQIAKQAPTQAATPKPKAISAAQKAEILQQLTSGQPVTAAAVQQAAAESANLNAIIDARTTRTSETTQSESRVTSTLDASSDSRIAVLEALAPTDMADAIKLLRALVSLAGTASKLAEAELSQTAKTSCAAEVTGRPVDAVNNAMRPGVVGG